MVFKSKKHILITSGPTAVPIDQMRVITNRSTGEMGRLLANAFLRAGYDVTLLEGQGVTTKISLSCDIKLKKFFFYNELDVLIRKEIRKKYAAFIHAAAVSDFALSKPLKGKISSAKGLRLHFLPTRKLINHIKKDAPETLLVGFKFETKLSKDHIMKEVHALIHDACCDLIVVNMLKDGRYAAQLLEPAGNISHRFKSKQDLVEALLLRMKVILS